MRLGTEIDAQGDLSRSSDDAHAKQVQVFARSARVGELLADQRRDAGEAQSEPHRACELQRALRGDAEPESAAVPGERLETEPVCHEDAPLGARAPARDE